MLLLFFLFFFLGEGGWYLVGSTFSTDTHFSSFLEKEPMGSCVYDASIVIGPNEMIGKECSFVNFSVRLLEISTVRGP